MGAQQTTTHVANDYKEDIYIKVSADRQYVTLREFGGKIGGSFKGVEVLFILPLLIKNYMTGA